MINHKYQPEFFIPLLYTSPNKREHEVCWVKNNTANSDTEGCSVHLIWFFLTCVSSFISIVLRTRDVMFCYAKTRAIWYIYTWLFLYLQNSFDYQPLALSLVSFVYLMWLKNHLHFLNFHWSFIPKLCAKLDIIFRLLNSVTDYSKQHKHYKYLLLFDVLSVNKVKHHCV